MPPRGVSFDVTKLVVASLVVIAIAAMTISGSISADAGLPIITTIVGYVLGNGRSVSQGYSPATAIDISADNKLDPPPVEAK